MRKLFSLFLLLFVAMAIPAHAQDETRNANREHLRATLDARGADIGVIFHQNDKNPYNFTATLDHGLKNAASLEIVASVTKDNTISFLVYPHYKSGYINIRTAKNTSGLMRTLLQFNYTNFMPWGADDTFDVFASYDFTLESGYPDASIKVVIDSIPNIDTFVGQMRPYIDGSNPG